MITARIEKAKKSKEDAKAAKEALEKELEKAAQQELDLKKLSAENASLREELSARRQEQQQTYVPKPLELSEYQTQKTLYRFHADRSRLGGRQRLDQ